MAAQREDGTPERNPLGLGPNDRESSNTGSIEDTAYDAVASDPYLTGEPRKAFDAAPTRPRRDDEDDAPGDERGERAGR
jgi:hypothetical protein